MHACVFVCMWVCTFAYVHVDEKIEDFVRGKLGRGLPTRLVPVEVLGQQMTSAGHEYGPIPLGKPCTIMAATMVVTMATIISVTMVTVMAAPHVRQL